MSEKQIATLAGGCFWSRLKIKSCHIKNRHHLPMIFGFVRFFVFVI